MVGALQTSRKPTDFTIPFRVWVRVGFPILVKVGYASLDIASPCGKHLFPRKKHPPIETGFTRETGSGNISPTRLPADPNHRNPHTLPTLDHHRGTGRRTGVVKVVPVGPK